MVTPQVRIPGSTGVVLRKTDFQARDMLIEVMNIDIDAWLDYRDLSESENDLLLEEKTYFSDRYVYSEEIKGAIDEVSSSGYESIVSQLIGQLCEVLDS